MKNERFGSLDKILKHSSLFYVRIFYYLLSINRIVQFFISALTFTHQFILILLTQNEINHFRFRIDDHLSQHVNLYLYTLLITKARNLIDESESKITRSFCVGVKLMSCIYPSIFLHLLFFSTDNEFQQPLHLVIRIRAAHQTQDHKAVLWVQVWVTQIQTIRWVRATRPSKQNNYQKQIYTLEVYNRERLIKIYTICVHSKCLHHFDFLSSIDNPFHLFLLYYFGFETILKTPTTHA